MQGEQQPTPLHLMQQVHGKKPQALPTFKPDTCTTTACIACAGREAFRGETALAEAFGMLSCTRKTWPDGLCAPRRRHAWCLSHVGTCFGVLQGCGMSTCLCGAEQERRRAGARVQEQKAAVLSRARRSHFCRQAPTTSPPAAALLLLWCPDMHGH